MKAYWKILVLLVLVAGCCGHVEQPSHGPWMVMDTADQDQRNRRRDVNALGKWMRQEAGGFVNFSSVGYEVKIYLDGDEGAVPRSKLVHLAEEARKQLPPECPIVILVETLGSAIARREESIAEWQEDIVRMRQIHTPHQIQWYADGEPAPPPAGVDPNAPMPAPLPPDAMDYSKEPNQ